MSGPGYKWICKKCASANEAQADTCASCACPAVVAPVTLDPPRERVQSEHFLMEPRSWFLMFPELPIAAVLLLAAPFWAVSLFMNNHPVAAMILLITAGGLVYAAYSAFRANEKWGAYASIVGLLIVGGVIASNT